jgi:V8-like Glu-specific endopeptidase
MESNIVLEDYIKNSTKPVSLEGMNKIIEQMKYSICKIHRVKSIGTGFLCNLPYNSVKRPFLITNHHVLNEEDIENNKKITISFNKLEIVRDILIDKSRIIITNKDLDFTIIEIKDKDNINVNNILDLDENINIGEEYINKIYGNESIYTLHYPKGENISASFGLIKGINDNKIRHSCCTEDGSSGAPILTLKDFKVVGIHFGYKKNLMLNEGTYIKSIILELSKYKINNIFQEDNNQLLQLNVNYNLSNNNVNEQEIKIIKDKNSGPIIPFPEEKNQNYNIIFEDSSNLKTNIIIPSDKDVNKLFDIYKSNRKIKDISNDKILFVYNGSFVDTNQNMKIKEIYQKFSKLTVICKK